MLESVETESIEQTKQMFARMKQRSRKARLIALEAAASALAKEEETL